jgi:hypothetical protein
LRDNRNRLDDEFASAGEHTLAGAEIDAFPIHV